MNVQRIESQCIIWAAQTGLCRRPTLCMSWSVRLLPSPCAVFSPISSSSTFKVEPVFYIQELNCQKKNKREKKIRMYAKHSNFLTIFGQAAMIIYSKLLIIRSSLWTMSTDIAFIWVTATLFVLCPFVKLFLNVYTWFSNCLFCIFKFLIRQCKLSPWCL